MHPRWTGAVLIGILLLPGGTARAQSHWSVDPKASLAWWQIDPHYNHLWATTCPADHSWQPGEPHDPGMYVDYKTRPKTSNTGHDDRVPLFPRTIVHAVCRQAVSGTMQFSDTLHWSGVRGEIVLLADSLITGLGFRDDFAHSMVFNTSQYPNVRFVIDSLTDIQPGPGDTLHAVAVGTFDLHGVVTPMHAAVAAWHDAAGFRVRGVFDFDAQDLSGVYGMSRVALGLGVILHRWRRIYAGVDVILRPSDD